MVEQIKFLIKEVFRGKFIKSKQFNRQLYAQILNAKELYCRVTSTARHYKYCFFTETSRIV